MLSFCYKTIPYRLLSEDERKRNKDKTHRIQRILSYLKDNFNRQTRIDDIAKMENLSKTYVSHLFTTYFGTSFQDYINMMRFEYSVRLMSDKSKSLLEISYESGFSGPKYMFRMLKKSFNCTPKEFKDNFIKFDETSYEEDPIKHEYIYS